MTKRKNTNAGSKRKFRKVFEPFTCSQLLEQGLTCTEEDLRKKVTSDLFPKAFHKMKDQLKSTERSKLIDRLLKCCTGIFKTDYGGDWYGDGHAPEKYCTPGYSWFLKELIEDAFQNRDMILLQELNRHHMIKPYETYCDKDLLMMFALLIMNNASENTEKEICFLKTIVDRFGLLLHDQSYREYKDILEERNQQVYQYINELAKLKYN